MCFERRLRQRLFASAIALTGWLGASLPVVAADAAVVEVVDVVETAPAATQLSAPENPLTAELWLSPRSCISVDEAAPCVDRIRVRWQLSAAAPVCFWQQGASEPLFCDEREQGERELPLAIQASTRFELLQQTGGALLARAEILVMSKAEPAKRRRYQHPWSIF